MKYVVIKGFMKKMVKQLQPLVKAAYTENLLPSCQDHLGSQDSMGALSL